VTIRSLLALAPKSLMLAPALVRASNELSINPWWWKMTSSGLIRWNRSFCGFLPDPRPPWVGVEAPGVLDPLARLGVETATGAVVVVVVVMVVTAVLGETLRFLMIALASFSDSDEDDDDDDELELEEEEEDELDEDEEDEVDADLAFRFWPATGVLLAVGASRGGMAVSSTWSSESDESESESDDEEELEESVVRNPQSGLRMLPTHLSSTRRRSPPPQHPGTWLPSSASRPRCPNSRCRTRSLSRRCRSTNRSCCCCCSRPTRRRASPRPK